MRFKISDRTTKDLAESVASSLDGGNNPGIYPFLPYLLQDLWELGTLPDDVINLIKKHDICPSGGRLLDLGCGKGAVSVRVAKELGLNAHGIDGMPEFIAEAQQYAYKFGVERLCIFETGDIREAVHRMRGYDIVVLGAVGPVFGDLKTTIYNLRACLKTGGYIIFDDCYTADETDQQRNCVVNRTEFLRRIEAGGMRIVEEIISRPEEISETNAEMYKKIETRGLELIKKHLDQRAIFEAYLKTQREENEFLESVDACGIFLLQEKTPA